MKPLCVSVLTLLTLFGVTLARGQSTNATLSGVVVDPSGRVIQSAEIEILNEATGVRYTSKTNAVGIYAVSILPPGQYRVQVSKVGFKTLIKPSVVLNVESAVALNFTLPVGASSESITVEGGASPINTTDGSVSTVVDRDFVANMPLNGRSFQDLLTLSPGVSQVANSAGVGYGVGYSGDIVVNGQRTESNYYLVDGVSADTGTMPGQLGAGAGVSGSLPGLTALGTTQSLTSVDALQEFRSTTSTYSAEYGRSPGGQFSFRTRSGTNELHGSLYDYLRNDIFDASNWFNNFYGKPRGAERQNDFGGTAGGPVVVPGLYQGKDRTFFFASYEGLRLDSPQPAVAVQVPGDALRESAPAALQPLLKAFPIAQNASSPSADGFADYVESVSDPSILNSTSVRVDDVLGSKVSLFGRFADSPSHTTAYSNAVRQEASIATRTVTLGATVAPAAHQSNDLRLNFTQNVGQSFEQSTNLGGATPFSLASIPGPGGDTFPQNNSELYTVFTFASFTSFSLSSLPSRQHQINLVDTHTWTIGRHNVKIGFDWRRMETWLPSVNPEEEVAFTSESQVLNNSPAFAFVNSYGAKNGEPVYNNFSTFVQDEWRATPRLSLALGLRWDVNPGPTNAGGPNAYTITSTDLLSTQLAPQGTPLWRTDWRGFAPRIGVAYQLNASSPRSTVLRLGGGVFYDTGNTVGSLGLSEIGFSSSATISSPAFPLTSSQLTLPAPSVAVPYASTVLGFDPNLRLPYSLQYSAAIEQSLSKRGSLTISYVGAEAHRLLTEFTTFPGRIGNPNFQPGAGLDLYSGRAASNYNALQMKYQRELSGGLQALVSYTWSHSIDNASSNFGISKLLRASSDFDIRQSLQAAVSYLTPRLRSSAPLAPLLNGWGTDFRLQARTAPPVDILGTQGLNAETGEYIQYQPDRVPGQPLYLYGAGYPGGRALNYKAFTPAASGVEGNLPRNDARAFDAVQLDAAIRRQVPLFDQLHLELRAEAFNLLNHPMFGSIYNSLQDGATRFGLAYTTLNTLGNLNSLYQTGGPRSLQLALKIEF